MLAAPPLPVEPRLTGRNETRHGAERFEGSIREYERPCRVAAVDRRMSVRARRPFSACRAERHNRRTWTGVKTSVSTPKATGIRTVLLVKSSAGVHAPRPFATA